MSIKRRLGRFAAGPRSHGVVKRGAQVRKGRLAAGLLLASVAVLMAISCGGSSSSSSVSSTPSTGGLYTFIADTPSCDVLSLSMFATEVDLHKVGQPSSTLVTIWPTNTSATSPVIEMSTLRDTMTIANVTSIASGTYDQVVIKAVVNKAEAFDSALSPPVSSISASVSNASVTVDLQPNLVVTGGKVSALYLDLNLPQSLAVDSQGQLTGVVKWVFSAQPLVASSSTGFGEMDDLHGFVTSVTSTSPGTGFTSSFGLQTLSQTASGAGPALSVDLTDKTDLIGVSKIDQLTTGSYVEVDGYVNENGNLVANAVQVEDREDVTKDLLGYVGPVLTVKKGSSGNVTQFEMLARETEPEDTTSVPVDTPITVNVSPSSTFNPYLLSSDLTSLASSWNLAFDSNTLVPGQEVVVHGVFNAPSSGTTTVAANSIYPRLQSVQGNFYQLVGQPGSDNRTGVFQLTPCASIFSGRTFMVVTDAQTDFVNTFGLTTLSPTTPLVVRGLMFFDASGSTFNNVQIPAGTLVLLAKQVRQL